MLSRFDSDANGQITPGPPNYLGFRITPPIDSPSRNFDRVLLPVEK
ncbi:uncharacterized protein An11g00340 [Aspergillus niger]|uniref:Contig An11c0010, genomic contig n=2 Tax=Aspergillus niger TaxID=5061 RepID=A5ABG9_ASPNC|nr:uncharacterized protein An11g00340 [Aspergillus niger]CAK48267.1 unnamed protein product [Aspergillus niger]